MASLRSLFTVITYNGIHTDQVSILSSFPVEVSCFRVNFDTSSNMLSSRSHELCLDGLGSLTLCTLQTASTLDGAGKIVRREILGDHVTKRSVTKGSIVHQ